MAEVQTNRNNKNSVFTALFSEKENFLELYNAIENTNYGSDTEMQLATLENVLFMGKTNDVAFIMGGKIVVLIEHQSTLNENMPMRMLIYVSKIYERLLGPRSLFRTKMLKVPKPEFIVLYNGEDEFPDRKEMRLSDMYMELGIQALELDLRVKVFNINKGRNEELAERSENLKGYEIFIYLVREYMKTLDRDSAIKRAIDDCVRQNVLKGFLEKHASEIRNMIEGEWDLNVAKEVWLEEGIEIGETRGREKERAELFALLDSGVSISEAKKRFGMVDNQGCG